MKRAFTLIEITLALGILAGGVLTIVGLYGFGYRESNQSREDVAAAAVADYVLSQLTAAASSTNVTWAKFQNLKNYPDDKKWGAYIDSNGRVIGNPTSVASGVFGSFIGDLGADGSYEFPSESFTPMKLKYGLVILHDDSKPSVVRFAFRATRQVQQLLASPTFYSEARFQGVVKEKE